MSLLSNKPRVPPAIADAENKVTKARERETLMHDRLATARAACEAAFSKQKEMLAGSDFSVEKLGTQNNRVGQAQATAVGLGELLQEAVAAREAAEVELAAAKDKFAREAEGVAIDKTVGLIDTALATYISGAQGLIAALAGQGGGRTVSVGLDYLEPLRDTTEGVQQKIGEVVSGFQFARADILAGGPMPTRAAAAPPRPVAPEVKRTTIFACENLRWKEGDQSNTVLRGTMAALPAEVAAYALENKLALPPKHPQVEKLQALAVGGWEPSRKFNDLDALMAAASAAEAAEPVEAVA